jgi:glutamate-1-semialdehyde 2,1-aminomutase
MNEVLEDEGVKWAVHGSYSGLHIFTNPDRADIQPTRFDAAGFIPQIATKSPINNQVRMGLLVNGVDVNPGLSGTISAVHGQDELAATVDAFRATIRALRREGAIR